MLSGAIGGYVAQPAFAAAAIVPGTPCTVTARACVDLDDQKAWLISDGKITKGPLRISSGGLGKETPVGTFHVVSKNKDHKSKEFPLPDGQPAPMPWAVFFAAGGIAFHGGDPKRASAGCIRMQPGDAETFFNTLAVGDQVQVTQSLDQVKGGFYGVNKQKPPTKAEQEKAAKNLAAARKKAAERAAAGTTDDSKSDDSKKEDSKKKDSKKEDNDD